MRPEIRDLLDFNQTNLGILLKQKIQEALEERGHVNVVVAGKSGVGKSTLINAIFSGNLAATGHGRPVTLEVREITKEGHPISLFDTRGLELDRFEDTLRALQDLVVERSRDPDPSRHIHVAWLCISEDSRRVETGESRVAELLGAHMPVIGVITKSRSDGGFRAEVQALLPSARNVVRVRALEEELDGGLSLPQMGLKELVDVTLEVVPEGQRQAFVAAQQATIAAKRREAHKIVIAAAATAAGIGATPIPFSDATLLAPLQVGMLARISAVFGLELTRGTLTTIVASATTVAGGTVAGRALVAGLLKLVPGAGAVVGGTISAATAAALTSAFGEAYVAVLSSLFERSVAPPSGDDVADAFAQRLRKKLKVS